MDGQRRYLRFPVSWAAAAQAASGQIFPLRVTDVSQGGLGVLADDLLPNGAPLRILLRVPVPRRPGDVRAVAVQARVVHQVLAAGGARAGLEFTSIAPADMDMLLNSAQKRG